MKVNQIKHSYSTSLGKNTRTMKETLVLESQKYSVDKTDSTEGKKSELCWAS